LNEKFNKLRMNSLKPNLENEKFFSELDSHTQLYHQKCTNVNQGLSFYQEFNYRLNDLQQKINDFVVARDIEKNELIKSLTMGSQPQHNPNNYSAYTYSQPQNNTITGMNYEYHYQYQPNNNKNNFYDQYNNNNNRNNY